MVLVSVNFQLPFEMDFRTIFLTAILNIALVASRSPPLPPSNNKIEIEIEIPWELPPSNNNKIIIETAYARGASTDGDLYLKVCTTDHGQNCCIQTLRGGFRRGTRKEFPMDTLFQTCIVFAKALTPKDDEGLRRPLYYTLGLVGNNGWKSGGIEIRSDYELLAKQNCILDDGGIGELDSDDRDPNVKPESPLKCIQLEEKITVAASQWSGLAAAITPFLQRVG